MEDLNKVEHYTKTMQILNDSPLNPSVDSSTDTLIPSSEFLFDTIDKET